MKKLNKILYLFLILVFFGSCTNFLNVEPIGKVTSENFLKTEEQIDMALVGVYSTLQYAYSNGSWASIWLIKNLPGDDVLCGGGGPADQPEYQYIDDFQIQPDNKKLEMVWFNLYRVINQCNTIIDKVDPNTPKKRQQVAEAKALRAFSYFQLVVMFGGVPLRLHNPVDTTEYAMPRASVDEVYAQIFRDFTEAIPDLPLRSEQPVAERFHMSKGAAQAFLGKAYLYHQDYELAADVLQEVINSGEYSLEPNFKDVWSKETEFGDESLFEISYSAAKVYNWGNFPWGGGNQSNIEVQLQGPRPDIFDLSNFESDSLLGFHILPGWGFNMPSRKIGQAFENEGDTLERGKYSVLSAEKFEQYGGVIVNPHAHDYEGYMRIKYTTRMEETNLSGTPELNYTTNWRLMRYADVLLLAAEAYHFLGDEATALNFINQVRARAGLPPRTSTDPDSVFQYIVKERQLELAFEASRFWDLVRWGLAEQELGDLGFVAGKNEVFPIPQNEIIANTAISEADQNPGY